MRAQGTAGPNLEQFSYAAVDDVVHDMSGNPMSQGVADVAGSGIMRVSATGYGGAATAFLKAHCHRLPALCAASLAAAGALMLACVAVFS